LYLFQIDCTYSRLWSASSYCPRRYWLL